MEVEEGMKSDGSNDGFAISCYILYIVVYCI